MKNMSMEKVWEKSLLTATSSLVILMGVPMALDLLKNPEAHAEMTVQQQVRNPASLSLPKVAIQKSEKTAVIKLDCDLSSEALSTEGPYLRIQGQLCHQSLDRIQVINQTNGFTANIMKVGSGEFTTDFLDLSEGINEIQMISTTDAGDSITKTFTVDRRSPAAEKN